MSLIIWIFLLFFFGILYSGLARNWQEWYFFFSHSHPVPSRFAWKEATILFFSFLNFFCYFSRIPIPGRAGMDQNKNFFFSHSLPLPSRFGFKRRHIYVFSFLKFFCYFSRIPYFGSGCNVSEREFFFSHILSLSCAVLAWKDAIMMFFTFSIFFWKALFRVEIEWIGAIIFIFLSLSAGPIPFWIEIKP